MVSLKHINNTTIPKKKYLISPNIHLLLESHGDESSLSSWPCVESSRRHTSGHVCEGAPERLTQEEKSPFPMNVDSSILGNWVPHKSWRAPSFFSAGFPAVTQCDQPPCFLAGMLSLPWCTAWTFIKCLHDVYCHKKKENRNEESDLYKSHEYPYCWFESEFK